MSELAVESIHEVCGMYFRSVLLPQRGTRIPQHTHDHAHANYCGAGAAQFWRDGVHVQDVKAGDVIEIQAGHLHEFVALEDNTRLTCVHDIASAESIKVRGL